MKDPTQLELGFGTTYERPRLTAGESRFSRAQWWFAQMRLAVERAGLSRPTTPRSPHQAWLTEPQWRAWASAQTRVAP